jgi:hypothetical protein
MMNLLMVNYRFRRAISDESNDDLGIIVTLFITSEGNMAVSYWEDCLSHGIDSRYRVVILIGNHGIAGTVEEQILTATDSAWE